jgi:hypothetical protein
MPGVSSPGRGMFDDVIFGGKEKCFIQYVECFFFASENATNSLKKNSKRYKI